METNHLQVLSFIELLSKHEVSKTRAYRLNGK